METKTYTNLLASPEKISVTHQEELTKIIHKYPYFQSAKALQLKSLKNNSSFLYNEALKKTAAYTTDRNILFEYITSTHFTQNEISEIIQQHDDSVLEIKVNSENISEKISLEIDQQIKAELKKAEAILNPNLFLRIPTKVEVEVEVETKIETNQPLAFNKEDSFSFSEWLQLSSATPIERATETEVEAEEAESKEAEIKNDVLNSKEQKFKLIEKFIQEKPSIKPLSKVIAFSENKTENKNLAIQYTQAPEALMTETLAKVYLQQKNYKKAIMAYKILILKYPEKSGYFADQIRSIKKLTKTENS